MLKARNLDIGLWIRLSILDSKRKATILLAPGVLLQHSQYWALQAILGLFRVGYSRFIPCGNQKPHCGRVERSSSFPMAFQGSRPHSSSSLFRTWNSGSHRRQFSWIENECGTQQVSLEHREVIETSQRLIRSSAIKRSCSWTKKRYARPWNVSCMAAAFRSLLLHCINQFCTRPVSSGSGMLVDVLDWC